MIVKMFQPRFAQLVRNFKKFQTIRPKSARPPKACQEVSLREWTGSPYRSPQRIIYNTKITSVVPITITFHGKARGVPLTITSVDSVILDRNSEEALARADGFSNWSDLVDWFVFNHGTSKFIGDLIKWQAPAKEVA